MILATEVAEDLMFLAGADGATLLFLDVDVPVPAIEAIVVEDLAEALDGGGSGAEVAGGGAGAEEASCALGDLGDLVGLEVLALAVEKGAGGAGVEEAGGGADVDPLAPGAADEDPGYMVLFSCILSNMINAYV